MRGIAALMVFTIHAGGLGLRSFGPVGNAITDNLQFGVVIFFVLSGYSIGLTLTKDAATLAFFVRRVFRIVPLYFTACAATLIFTRPGQWDSLLAHLSFWNVFDLRYANDLIGVEWTIPVEMSFYLVAPIIFAVVTRGWWPAVVVLAIVSALPPIREMAYVALGGEFFAQRGHTLGWHLYAFLFGILAQQVQPRGRWRYLGGIGIVLFAAVMVTPPANWTAPLLAVATVLLIWGCSSARILRETLSATRLRWLGKVSYSVYLLHLFVLAALSSIPDPQLRGWIALPLVLILAGMTEALIERPAQRIGKKVADSFGRRPRGSVYVEPVVHEVRSQTAAERPRSQQN